VSLLHLDEMLLPLDVALLLHLEQMSSVRVLLFLLHVLYALLLLEVLHPADRRQRIRL